MGISVPIPVLNGASLALPCVLGMFIRKNISFVKANSREAIQITDSDQNTGNIVPTIVNKVFGLPVGYPFFGTRGDGFFTVAVT